MSDRWHRPSRLDDALRALGERRWTVLAGGTDLYAATGRTTLAPPVLDLGAIDELRGVRAEEAGAARDGASDGALNGALNGAARQCAWLHLGALATWADLIVAPLAPQFAALPMAAREVGGAQVHNRGTIGGNLCNASPAADGAVALLALDAQVVLARHGASRTMTLADFLLGARRTALAEHELLVAVRLPVRAGKTRSTFLKLGHRRYMVISIAAVAASVTIDAHGAIERAAIAVGACGPVAVRLGVLEARLVGVPAGEAAALAAATAPGELAPEIAPIDDVRATAAYRREAVVTLVARALAEVCASEVRASEVRAR